jgi:hypothetical protein
MNLHRLILFILGSLAFRLDAQDPPTYLASIDPHEASGIPYADLAKGIVSDGSNLYIINGYVDVLDYFQRIQHLIKINLSDFNAEKIVTLTGPQGDMIITSILLHPDGHLYFSGGWVDYTVERSRIYIAKYTTDFEEVWTNYLPSHNDEGLMYWAMDICAAFDGDIMLAYHTQVTPGPVNVYEGYVMKLDTAGAIQWDKHLPDTSWISTGRGNIVPTDDGHYLVSTYGPERILPPELFILHKIDEEGDIVWTQYRQGWQKKFQAPRIADLPGGGAVMGVVRDTFFAFFDNLPTAPSQFYYALEAFTPDGEAAWRYSWFYKVNATIEVLRRAANDDIIGCGFWFEYDDPYRGWIFRFSPDGELKWSRHYNDAPNRPWALTSAPLYFNRLVELPDRRIAITGFAIDSTDYPGANGINSNVLLMVLDSMGCLVPGCEGEDQIISSTEGWQVIHRTPLLALQVSPNPAKEHIRLQLPDGVPVSGQPYQLMAFDDLGRRIWTGLWHGELINIGIGRWPPGYITLVCLREGQPVASARILVENR